MNTFEAIKKRRSIRKYDSNYVPSKAEINQLLEAAMMAPSALNTRPWEFIVIENQEIKKKLVEAHPHAKMLLEAPVVICIVARPDYQSGKCSSFWPQDCGAASQNILLSALELGLGTCWCGVYPNEERVLKVKEILSIDKGIPFNLIAVGKALENPFPRGKFEEERIKYIK